MPYHSIPITIITGFLGAGKTTILLNLIPQLPPDYRLALLKNEFGDLAIDSQIASANSISGIRELLNGCICCNLVGQLGDALLQLRDEVKPDRIVIETSGSAFPATMAMEVNRVSRENNGLFVLDGVISVIDVENWKGYEDTSYTAKLQAKYTDLVIFNKWEDVPEEQFDACLDRVADLELDTAWVKSARGVVDKDLLLGIDGALLAKEISDRGHSSLDLVLLNGADDTVAKEAYIQEHSYGLGKPLENEHQSEVDVLSISLTSTCQFDTVNQEALATLLLSAPKDEVYRIKGIIQFPADAPPEDSSGQTAGAPTPIPTPAPTAESTGGACANGTPATATGENNAKTQNYILNWAFGRWTYTHSPASIGNTTDNSAEDGASLTPEKFSIARMTLILSRGESHKWTRKLETDGLLEIAGENPQKKRGSVKVERIG
ncbi:CobW domain-containing protein [Paracoccidioides lutzii Pb01]|uniref:CobW domain-containing protein n=1 Tax=Paracoccidioides lutzii (strain ATCC MYA-826 / Pb01) TaxID=502779 RepID=C1GYJ8_PARBA|nr:CobW domain-containing protein [Paracoccidioides lutzii Pb01]EEH41589.1 CobW domain-containing protein [Paracoccidioides lutzii Pb01]